ncbi:hypothetical protein CEXT_27491, partial [Caerostris extrusa]
MLSNLRLLREEDFEDDQ